MLDKNNKSSKLKMFRPYIHKRIEARYVDFIIIIISIFLSLTCLIANNYSREISSSINQIEFVNSDKQTLTVTTEKYSEDLNSSNVSKIGKLWPCKTYNYFNESQFGKLYFGAGEYSVNALSVGFFDKNMILPSFDQYGATERVSLIDGYLPVFNENTEDDYIFLHKSVKNIIFGENENAIGKQIRFYFDNEYHIFKVAGILSDTLDVLRIIDKMNKRYLVSSIYRNILPIVHVSRSLSHVSKMLLFFDEDISLTSLDKMRVQLTNSSFRELSITSLEEQIDTKIIYIDANDRILKVILNIVTVVLCSISVLLIFISIKRRKVEIGIRKSLGASTLDLIAMFLSEIIYCFVIATLYSIPISSFIMLLISIIIRKEVFTLVFPITFSCFAVPICLIFLVIIFSSLITTFYFSNRKISICLKE